MNFWRYLFVIAVILLLLGMSFVKSEQGRSVIKEKIQQELSSALNASVAIGDVELLSQQRIALRDISIDFQDRGTLRIGTLHIQTQLIHLLFKQLAPTNLELHACCLSLGNWQSEDFDAKVDISLGENDKLPNKITLQACDKMQNGWELQLLADRKEQNLELAGHVLMDRKQLFAITGFIPMATDLPINLTMSGQSNIPQAIHAVIPPEIFLAGQLLFTAELSGTPKAPRFHATANVVDGTMESFVTGALLRHVTANLEADEKRITLTTFQAQDTQRGTISGKGSLDLNTAQNFPFLVNLKLNKATVVALDEMNCMLSGDLRLYGSRHEATLEGALTTDEVAIDLEECQKVEANPLDITFVAALDEQLSLPSPHSHSAKLLPLYLNLQIQCPNNIAISNDNLNSQWKGSFKVLGTLAKPLLHGDLHITHGEYRFNGRKFALNEGTITFGGEFAKKTSLFVIAELQINHTAIETVLKGPIDCPNLHFRSTPPLSQREILSWILFGRGMSDISAFQGAELAKSINILKSNRSAQSEFSNPIERIKETIGLDRIDINNGSGDGNAEFALQLGKYLSPNVFLGISKSFSSNAKSIGIEVNLSKKIKLHAEINDGAQKKLHLKWKHDY